MPNKMERFSTDSGQTQKTGPGRLCAQPLSCYCHHNSSRVQAKIKSPIATSEVRSTTTNDTGFGDLSENSSRSGKGHSGNERQLLEEKLVYDQALMEHTTRKALAKWRLRAGDTMYCALGKSLVVKVQPQTNLYSSIPMCAKLIISPNNTATNCPEIYAQRIMADEGCAPPVLFSGRASNEATGCCWVLVQELLTPIDRVKYMLEGRGGLTRVQFQNKPIRCQVHQSVREN
jgi:hypothetical protein